MVKRNMKAGRLQFTSCYEEGLAHAEVAFIAVATPSTEIGEANLSFLKSAATSIAKHMSRDLLIVNKSTAPVGTCHQIKEWIREELKEKKLSFDVVSNPEFLRRGNAIQDFMKPDRVIIGSDSEKSTSIMKETGLTILNRIKNQDAAVRLLPADTPLLEQLNGVALDVLPVESIDRDDGDLRVRFFIHLPANVLDLGLSCRVENMSKVVDVSSRLKLRDGFCPGQNARDQH